MKTGPDRDRVASLFVLVGRGTMSLPALFAAALDTRVSGVSCDGGLVSFVGATARAVDRRSDGSDRPEHPGRGGRRPSSPRWLLPVR